MFPCLLQRSKSLSVPGFLSALCPTRFSGAHRQAQDLRPPGFQSRHPNTLQSPGPPLLSPPPRSQLSRTLTALPSLLWEPGSVLISRDYCLCSFLPERGELSVSGAVSLPSFSPSLGPVFVSCVHTALLERGGLLCWAARAPAGPTHTEPAGPCRGPGGGGGTGVQETPWGRAGGRRLRGRTL